MIRRRRRQRSLATEILERRILLARQSIEVAGTAWFPDVDQTRFERYDIENQQWLTPVVLGGFNSPINAVHIDESGIFAASGKSVYQFSLAGSGKQLLTTTQFDVLSLHSDGDLLLVNQGNWPFIELTSLRKSTKSVIDQLHHYSGELFDVIHSSETNRLLGRDGSHIVNDSNYAEYSDDGHFLRAGQPSLSHTEMSRDASWPVFFMENDRVVDSVGSIFSVDSFRWLGTIGQTCIDVEMLGSDVPVVLSGMRITAYNQAFQTTGSFDLTEQAFDIVVSGNHVLAFREDAANVRGISVEAVPLSALNPALPNSPVDPASITFIPDATEIMPDGTVLLFHRLTKSVFRWNTGSQSWGPTISLVGTPEQMVYSATTNSLYFGYTSGSVTKIDLGMANPAESSFVTLNNNFITMMVADQYLLVLDGSAHFKTFRADGSLAAQQLNATSAISETMVWNPIQRKAVLLSNSGSPHDLYAVNVTVNGAIGSGYDSPHHGDVLLGIPLSVSPDGSRVALANGGIHDGTTLARRPESIPVAVFDGHWLPGGYFTIRESEGSSIIERWDGTSLELLGRRVLNGKPVTLLPVGTAAVHYLTSDQDGRLLFQRLDANLQAVGGDPGFQITETFGQTIVTEDGGSDSFAVVLTRPPVSNVTLRISVGGSDEIVTNMISLAFTPSNWNQQQIVEVRGIDDATEDGDQQSRISLSIDPAGSDSSFAGVAAQQILVGTLDNDGEFAGVLPAIRVDDTIWFAKRSSAEILRYDTSTQSWLTPLIPEGNASHPTAIHVEPGGIYLAFGKTVFGFAVDGSQRRFLANVEGDEDVTALLDDGSLLIASQISGRLVSLDTVNHTVVARMQSQLGRVRPAISASRNRITGLGSVVEYSDAGRLTTETLRFNVPQYSGVNEYTIFPVDDRFISNLGEMFATDSLRSVGKLPGSIRDVTFHGQDVPIVLSGTTVTAYSQAFIPTGSSTVREKTVEIVAVNAGVFAFSVSPDNEIREQIVPVSSLKLGTPGTPPSPIGAAYAPEEVFVASNEVLLFSRTHKSIFRWNSQTREFGPTIVLSGFPEHVTYSSVNQKLYLSYSSGAIHQIDIAAANPVETPFVTLPSKPFVMVSAGEFVLTGEFRNNSPVLTTYSPSGAKLSSANPFDFPIQPVWNQQQSAFYFLRESSPTDLMKLEIKADGTIGILRDSPLHTSEDFITPIRFSPDGSRVIMGSGVMHDAVTLARLTDRLPTRFPPYNPNFQDGQFVGNDFVSLRKLYFQIDGPESSPIVQLQISDMESMQVKASRLFNGTSGRVVSLGDNQIVAVIQDADGRPSVHLLDPELQPNHEETGFRIIGTDHRRVVTEDAEDATVSIVLNRQPLSSVVLRLALDHSNKVRLDRNSLTFDATNWDVPQSVTVSGVDDTLWDGDTMSLLTVAVDAAVSDNSFGQFDSQHVAIHTLDNDFNSAGFLQSLRVNNEVWFVRKSSSRIERFDLESSSWLTPIDPGREPAHPSAAYADSTGLYLAIDRTVYRFALDGTGSTRLFATGAQVSKIHADGDLLLISLLEGTTGAGFLSYNKSTGTLINAFQSNYVALTDVDVSPGANRIIGSIGPNSGATVYSLRYSEEGRFSDPLVTNGGTPGPARVWISPAGTHAVTSKGGVYDLVTNRWIGSAGNVINDVVFVSDSSFVALFGQKLTRFQNFMLPSKSVQIPFGGTSIQFHSQDVIVFGPDSFSPSGQKTFFVPLSALGDEEPGQPINPVGFAYTPESVIRTGDNSVLLFDRESRSLFRWNQQTQTYGQTIPLVGDPLAITWSEATNTVYLLHASNRIRQINLNESAPRDRSFLSLQIPAISIVAAGRFLCVYDEYNMLRSFDSTGHEVDSVQHFLGSKALEWNAANQQIYNTADGTSPSYFTATYIRQQAANGHPAGSIVSSAEKVIPGYGRLLWAASDGSFIVTQGGSVFDGKTLARLPDFPEPYLIDAAWTGSKLTVLSGSDLKQWDFLGYISPTPDVLRTISGEPKSLTSLSDDTLLLITNVNGVPVLTVLDYELNEISSKPALIAPEESPLRDSTPTLRWSASPGAVTYELKIESLTSVKPFIRKFRVTTTSVTLIDHLASGTYRVSVVALNANNEVVHRSQPIRFSVDHLAVVVRSQFTVSESPRLTWSGHRNAASFKVWINDLDAQSIIWRQDQITVSRFQLPSTLPPGRYGVWVQSVDRAGVASEWSQRRVFDCDRRSDFPRPVGPDFDFTPANSDLGCTFAGPVLGGFYPTSWKFAERLSKNDRCRHDLCGLNAPFCWTVYHLDQSVAQQACNQHLGYR